MKAIDLIGLPLKSSEIIDLLDDWEMEVTYDFDRCFENMPDTYWSASKENGILLRFDENQELSTIYAYQKETDGYTPVDSNFVGAKLFENIEEVRAFGEENEIPFTEGGGSFLGNDIQWIKLNEGTHLTHYEFRPHELNVITIQKPEPADRGNG